MPRGVLKARRLSFVDKLHACKKCETCFIRRSHLDIHMRTHIEESRRLSAIEAALRCDYDTSSPAVPEDTEKTPSPKQESVKRRSTTQHVDDEVTKSLSKKARKSLAKSPVNGPKSAPGKSIAKRNGSALSSTGWRYAKLTLSQRTKTLQGAAVTFYA